MKRLIIFLSIIIPISLFAQNFQINGTFRNLPLKTIYLLSYYGDKLTPIDSVKTSLKGDLTFKLTDETPNGLYRIAIGRNKAIDLIFNYENIDFTADAIDPDNTLEIKGSQENILYHSYLKNRNYNQYKLELLQPLLSYYPVTDTFFSTLTKEFNQIQDNYENFTRGILKNHPKTYAASLISMDHKPSIDPELSPQAQQGWLKAHYFDGKHFNNTELIRSNAYTSSLLAYLSLYQNSQISKDQLEQEFMIAVDSMLAHTRENPYVYEFIVDYLIGGFDQYGFNKVMTHLASNAAVEEYCENTERKSELEKRIETLQKLAPGNPAPEISNLDLYGKEVKLSDLDKEYTVIVFWSSWCPHCQNLLPDLHTYYQDNKDILEVLSISLDTLSANYQQYLVDHRYQWINTCDYKGWDNQAAIDYGIYATPNMFLLDKEKKIIARPTNIIELRDAMKK